MVKQALLRAKVGLILWLMLSACGQHSANKPVIPNIFVSADKDGWQRREGRMWLNNEPFSGWQYQCQASGDTTFVGAYSGGKAEGKHWSWHENRRVKEIRQYSNGWQEGQQRGWHESGSPAFLYLFQHDVYEGPAREWYPDGRTARFMHYHEGQENGRQQMWFADGSLQANYVVREGRTYGFTGVKNCVTVSNSIHVSP